MKEEDVSKAAGSTVVVVGTIVAIVVVGLIILMLWNQIVAVVS